MRPQLIRVSPNLMTAILLNGGKSGHRGETQGKGEGRGRDWNAAATSQATPMIVGNTGRQETGMKHPPSEPSVGTSPAGFSDF